MSFENLKVGDTVIIACYSGHGTGGKENVTAIKTKYDEDTGAPYKVIVCGEHEFLAGSGEAHTPPLFYYISCKV